MSVKRTAPSDPALSHGEADGPEAEAMTEEKVGRGHPPSHTRFQPGQSGNPRGRPKGSKSIDQVLRQALEQRVPDPRGGRRTVRMLDVIIQGLVLSAARRDLRALRLLLMLLERYQPSDAERITATDLSAADREILAEFAASVTASFGQEGNAP